MGNSLIRIGVGCGGDEYEVQIEVNANEVKQIDKNKILINGAILTFDEDVEFYP